MEVGGQAVLLARRGLAAEAQLKGVVQPVVEIRARSLILDAVSQRSGGFDKDGIVKQWFSDCNGVLDGRRLVQASVESGSSKLTRNGYGVVR